MLTQKECETIKEELLTSRNPIYFFHDDPDGLASFILFYRFLKEGKGFVVKAFPQIKEVLVNKTIEHDKIFVLDIAIVDQEFIDKSKKTVVWIDHHNLLERNNVLYFNPRKKDNLNVPTPALCYQVVQQDLWIAFVGCIGDWYLPEFVDEFVKIFPDLCPQEKTIEQFYFNSLVGKLIKIFSFNLKGDGAEVSKSIKVITRIESPYEILNQETPEGKFLYKRYEKINQHYEGLLKQALNQKPKGKLFIFTYKSDYLSLTKDLSNELLYKFPDKVVILGREKDDEVRCSFRTGLKINLNKILQKALVGIQGYGGGHEQACGGAIKKQDFQRFLDNLEREL